MHNVPTLILSLVVFAYDSLDFRGSDPIQNFEITSKKRRTKTDTQPSD
jgi:hypothetical protein